MRSLDLMILKNTTPDPYCGYNELCAQGASELVSGLIWMVIIGLAMYVGYKLREHEWVK